MTKELILSRGLVALVDDEDYEWLNQWKWSAMLGRKTFYAVRNSPRPRRESIFLHRVIIDAPKGMQADHINGDGLDNRRSNLRLATNAENIRNSHIRSDSTSGYKGVNWDKSNSKWIVRIVVRRKIIHLGRFDDLEEAALVYDKAAREHFGEFARTNRDMGLLK